MRVAHAFAGCLVLAIAGCGTPTETGAVPEPQLELLEPIPDTIYGPVLSIRAKGATDDYRLVVDSGTAVQQMITGPSQIYRNTSATFQDIGTDASTLVGVRIEPPNELANGPHTFVLENLTTGRRLAKTVFVKVDDIAYDVTELPNPTTLRVWPGRINDDGIIVGNVGQWFPDVSNRPIAWRGEIAELLAIPAPYTYGRASAINAAGDIAGDVNHRRAVVWRNGVPQLLPSPDSSYAWAAAHSSAGTTTVVSRPTLDLIRNNGYKAREEAVIGVITFSPLAANDAGQIVGSKNSGKGESPAAEGVDVQMTEFHPTTPSWTGRLTAINENGAVVGFRKHHAFESFLSIPGKDPVALRPFVGSWPPVAVNDSNVVVTDKGGLYRNGRGYRISLPDGWTLVEVRGMNNRGQLSARVLRSGLTEPVAARLTPR